MRGRAPLQCRGFAKFGDFAKYAFGYRPDATHQYLVVVDFSLPTPAPKLSNFMISWLFFSRDCARKSVGTDDHQPVQFQIEVCKGVCSRPLHRFATLFSHLLSDPLILSSKTKAAGNN